MMGPTWSLLIDLFQVVETGLSLVCLFLGHSGFNWWCSFAPVFSGIVSHPGVLRVLWYVSVESLSLTYHRSYLWVVCTLCWFIDGLGNLHADQTFWITADAEGEGLDPVKGFKTPVIYYWPLQCGISVVVPQCYMLRLYVYSFSNMVNWISVANYASCFVLFCNLK